MIRRPPRSTLDRSSAASDVYKRQPLNTTLQDIHVDLPVGQPKWGGEFAQKIVWLSSQQNQVAEIRLNPAHLGPVEVMLSICLLYTSPSPRDRTRSRMPSSA